MGGGSATGHSRSFCGEWIRFDGLCQTGLSVSVTGYGEPFFAFRHFLRRYICNPPNHCPYGLHRCVRAGRYTRSGAQRRLTGPTR